MTSRRMYAPSGWKTKGFPLARRGAYYISTPAEHLTKLPREKTTLVRVTGAESAVDWFCREGEQGTAIWREGRSLSVRVERVEDPDAKAER